jgi:DNA polymerase-3 subunit delta
MKKLSVASFSKYLTTSPPDIFYVFYGEERFFIDQLITELENYIFGDQPDRQLNCHTFYGGESNLAEIISTCMSYAMFGAKKVVVVKEFDKLKSNALEELIKYVLHPQKSTVLVLAAEKWGKANVYQEILKLAVSVPCQPLREDEIYSWLYMKVKNANIMAERDSILFLIENIGSNLLRLSSEIDKILNFIGPGGKLTLDLVTQLTGFSREVNIFNFQKYLAEKKFESSLKIGMQLLEQGEVLAGILPMLYGFFRKIWMVKSLRSKNLNTTQILQQLDGKMYFYKDVFVAEQKFTIEQVQNVMERLLEAEVQLKTSPKPADSILTMLCYHICQNQELTVN